MIRYHMYVILLRTQNTMFNREKTENSLSLSFLEGGGGGGCSVRGEGQAFSCLPANNSK